MIAIAGYPGNGQQYSPFEAPSNGARDANIRVSSTATAPRVWISGLIMAGVTASGLAVTQVREEAAFLVEQTSAPMLADQYSAVAVQVQQAPIRQSTDEIVRSIHDESGFTWEQLARFLGVSRRSVHMWASGGRVNARHIEMISDLARLVHQAPGLTPDERRTWLFSGEHGGETRIEAFLARHRKARTPVTGSGYTAGELLGGQI